MASPVHLRIKHQPCRNPFYWLYFKNIYPILWGQHDTEIKIITGHLRDITDLVPDHHNNANTITIKGVHTNFWVSWCTRKLHLHYPVVYSACSGITAFKMYSLILNYFTAKETLTTIWQHRVDTNLQSAKKHINCKAQ